MKITPCPKCGTALDVTGFALGRAFRCTGCGHMTVVAPSIKHKAFIFAVVVVGGILLCPCGGMLVARLATHFGKPGSSARPRAQTNSTEDRQAPYGTDIPRGTPLQHVNDTMD